MSRTAFPSTRPPSLEFFGRRQQRRQCALAPEKNNTVEVGAKVDLLGGKLSLTGAVFQIDKTNLRIVNDPSLPTALQIIVLDGLGACRGVEVGVAGQ